MGFRPKASRLQQQAASPPGAALVPPEGTDLSAPAAALFPGLEHPGFREWLGAIPPHAVRDLENCWNANLGAPFERRVDDLLQHAAGLSFPSYPGFFPFDYRPGARHTLCGEDAATGDRFRSPEAAKLFPSRAERAEKRKRLEAQLMAARAPFTPPPPTPVDHIAERRTREEIAALRNGRAPDQGAGQ